MLALTQPLLAGFSGPAPLGRSSGVSMMAKSLSLPFLEAPPALDGSMAGDVVSCCASPLSGCAACSSCRRSAIFLSLPAVAALRLKGARGRWLSQLTHSCLFCAFFWRCPGI